MKLFKVMSIAVLCLLLGSIAPVYAQKGQEEKGGGGQKPQQAQHAQQPQRAQQAQRTQQQPQRTQQAQRSQQQPQRTQQAQGGGHRPQGQLSAGRIPDARFHSNFGRGHEFRMSRPVYYGGYSQFQYSGYWFNFVDAWPSDWLYSDDVYVDYYGNAYYLYNPRHPGIRIAIRIAI